MNASRSLPPAFMLVAALAYLAVPSSAVELVDDRAITLHSASEVDARRKALIRFIWGEDSFPSGLPDVVLKIDNPVKSVDGFARVDELRIDMAPGLQGLAWHYTSQKPNSELVIVHHGHSSDFAGDYGLVATINALLREGYGVLAVFMPHLRPGDATGNHDAMFQQQTTGSPIKWFLESTAVNLNYLKSRSAADRFPSYRAFHMTGLSGGGWTTTIYAAVDPTIRVSVPVAGTIPLYLRARGSIGDREQTDPAFYRLTGYPDLYLMGSHGKGRSQVQILNRRDNCCFGEAQHDSQTAGVNYEDAMHEFATRVQAAAKEIGDTTYRLEIDETAPGHLVSQHAIEDVLLAELRKHR
jgi:hypothetical protein